MNASLESYHKNMKTKSVYVLFYLYLRVHFGVSPIFMNVKSYRRYIEFTVDRILR